MAQHNKPRAMGINHVALEVGDVDEALAFYGRIFDFKLRGKSEDVAFIDLGDQFLALQKLRRQKPDDGRHVGLVVDDRESARAALLEAGVECLRGPRLDFLDPWGNRIEVVGYADVQFSKAPNVLRGMELLRLSKSAAALKELADKGMDPRSDRHTAAAPPAVREAGAGSADQFGKGLGNIVDAIEEALLARGIEGGQVAHEAAESAGATITVSADGRVQTQHFAREEIEDSGEAIDAPVAVKVRMLVSHFVR